MVLYVTASQTLASLRTWFMVQSFMQDSFTTLVLLHLHQQLSQVVAQEVLLLCLQGSFVVIYRLCNSGLASRSVRPHSESCLCLKGSTTQTLM